MNITLRNIPDEIINKIKVLSKIEKRSINNQILILLEKGLLRELGNDKNRILSKETQIIIWQGLAGKWKDNRSTQEIIADIYKNRTLGRDIKL